MAENTGFLSFPTGSSPESGFFFSLFPSNWSFTSPITLIFQQTQAGPEQAVKLPNFKGFTQIILKA